MIAYVKTEQASPMDLVTPTLAVVTLATGQSRALTRKPALDPAWSSRGDLAFSRYTGADYDIFVLRRGASLARRLTFHRGSSPEWSPSGRTLLFQRGRDVYRVRADGSGLRRIRRRATGAVFSPDGRKILFFAITDRLQLPLYVAEADGSRPRRLSALAGTAVDWQPLR